MSDLQTIAAALYGSTTTPAAPTAPVRPSQPAPAPTQPSHAGKPLSDVQEAQVPATEPSEMASTLFNGGEPAGSADEYSSAVLASAWDSLEFLARESQNEDDVAKLGEGRREVAAVMHELAVPVPIAKEITTLAAQYGGRQPLADQALDAANARCETELRRMFGPDMDRQLEYARAAYRHAVSRPGVGWWLSQLNDQGLGSDPKAVAAFAKIGARMAKRGGRR